MYTIIFEDHIFCGWDFVKGFRDYIFEFHLCPSYGMYPGIGKFKNENFTDSKTTTKSVKFTAFENYCVYSILCIKICLFNSTEAKSLQ